MCLVQAVKLEAFLVQVIGIGNLPVQAGFAGLQGFRAELEGFIGRQEVGLCKRITRALGLSQAGETHQQQSHQQTHL